jgi:dTMP kinase
MFITLEGQEGSGKSTHSKKISDYLVEKGYEVVSTIEPGGTQIGRKIRGFLLDPETDVDDLAELFLFAADRAQHVQKVILPALSRSKIVVSDRFIDSTIAYQIGGRALPEDLVRYLNMVSSKGLIPDLTIILDVLPETGIGRIKRARSTDRFESEELKFHRRVREKYLEIAKENPGRIKVISTEKREVNEIQAEIVKLVESILKQRNKT